MKLLYVNIDRKLPLGITKESQSAKFKHKKNSVPVKDVHPLPLINCMFTNSLKMATYIISFDTKDALALNEAPIKKAIYIISATSILYQ